VTAASGRPASADARLARLGFVEPERALAELEALRLDADDPMLTELARAADPDLAVSALAGMADPELLSALRSDELLRSRLFSVLGASTAFGTHLSRYPQDWRLLTGSRSFERVSEVGAPDDAESLRVAHRRGLLRIAARDLSGEITVEDAADELSDLAVSALRAGLALVAEELGLTARRGGPATAAEVAALPLAVIAMGKCGARELNYVSDVDVIFVSDGNEEQQQLATRLAEGMVRICTAATSEGMLFALDAGLRPEGRQGALVRTLGSCEAYYRRWARTWEFQALLKARPVAGNPDIGARFADLVEPMVWTAAERPHFVADVQEMRRRVERSLSPTGVERDIKLGPGGLRDVEFAVQLLQLVHGRADERVRIPATLGAIRALAAGGYIGRQDAEQMAGAYRFLRTVEHRLQLQRLQRTHAFPSDPAALRWLGRALGLPGDPAQAAVDARAAHAREVRRLHEKLFYRPLLEAVARLPAEEIRLSPEAARSRLQALGFRDTASALKHLEALTRGVSRTAAIQRTLLPAMLGWFADAADPDAGLLAYRQVSDALGTTPWYLRLLRDEGAPGSPAAERLARLLATSPFIATMVSAAPEAVAMVRNDAELQPRSREQIAEALLAVVRRNDEWEAAVAAARGVRRVELVRIAAADVLGLLTPEQVGRGLSDAANATIEAALQVAIRKMEDERRGPLPIELAVIAMGRLGGGEIGYGSDADVIWVHEPHEGVPDSEFAAAAAVAADVAEEVRRLLALPAADPPLQLDTGLRPEGKNGALSRSLASYRAYYERWSLGWEAQALLRASFLAGNAELGERFLHLADELRYPKELPEDAVAEVARLKKRMQTERIPRGIPRARHLKLGPGGLTDVEWAAQVLQLRHAGGNPELRTTSTLEALAAEERAGLLSTDEHAALVEAWTLATRVRNALMLTTGRASDVLPDEQRALDRVARLVGYPAARSRALLDDHQRIAGRAREVVDALFARLLEPGRSGESGGSVG
jgi:glutamate-ammonia-ligase adenylyltransferase